MSAKFLLIDSFSHIYRSYFALPRLTSPDGHPVQAILGFIRAVQKLRRDLQPTHLAAVFDLGPPQRRLALLPDYKQQRPPTPRELEMQLPYIRKVILFLGVPLVEQEGEEADDVIATLATEAAADDARVFIATSDKDFFQLLGPNIRIVGSDGRVVDEVDVCQRFGVPPHQLVDLFSLAGDAVDNITGLPGIGLKRAGELLRQYGSLENLIQEVDRIPNTKLANTLRAEADRLRRNRELVRLRTDIPLSVSWGDLKSGPVNRDALADLYQTLGLKSLLKELNLPSQPSQPELI